MPSLPHLANLLPALKRRLLLCSLAPLGNPWQAECSSLREDLRRVAASNRPRLGSQRPRWSINRLCSLAPLGNPMQSPNAGCCARGRAIAPVGRALELAPSRLPCCQGTSREPTKSTCRERGGSPLGLWPGPGSIGALACNCLEKFAWIWPFPSCYAAASLAIGSERWVPWLPLGGRLQPQGWESGPVACQLAGLPAAAATRPPDCGFAG